MITKELADQTIIELEAEAGLVTEAIHDIMLIVGMNSPEDAFELIKTQFLVVNRQDLI